MKKLLTLLLTLLMVFTLVGCNSKEDTPIVNEPEQQEEVVEPINEDEPIVGGFVDAEDKIITDELKDIFNKALEGLLGATYEPQELVATQVVAGTNYKFLANGTKTTNPITKGTYYIYVNKDLQGNVELLDIETIEEKQEEVKTQDITQMSFWVVFYDQYGNELQREALKYGTVPEYKTWLPEGFDKWVYKKSGKDVGTLKAITGNTYYQAVCHEVYHPSSDPTPEPTPTVTNYTVSFNLNGITGTTPDSQTIANGNLVTKPDDPTYANHTFAGWYKTKNQATGALSDPWNFDTDTVTTDMTLYAQWTRKINDIISTIDFPMYDSGVPENAWINNANQGIKIYDKNNILCVKNDSKETQLLNYDGVTSDDAKKNGNLYTYNNATIKISIIFNMAAEDKLESIEIEAQDDADDDYKNVVGTYVAKENLCLAKGTLITMADGSKEPIENLYEGDLIRTFDHNTGKVSSARIMDYWQYEEKKSGLIILHFTNDIDVNIVTGHGFYNKEENKYVLLNACNVNEYIGKHFYNVDNNSWETLLSATYSDEKVDTFFIATEGQFNTVAEGMLNVEDGVYYVLRNTFDFDNNMKIDEMKKANDIECYGLFDSTDFEYLTKEAFEKYGAANLKVALGKGIITEEFLDIIKAESITYESENIVEEYIPENVQHSVR